MRSPREIYFAANWKMNKSVADVVPYVNGLKASVLPLISVKMPRFETIIAPPATHLQTLRDALAGTPFVSAAQNCGTAPSGAFTAEISPVVLKELGVAWVILGHSERRHVYGESNALIAARLKAAWEAERKVILCIGETLEERKAGKTFAVLEEQLGILKQGAWGKLVLAYEPVWAIGTGETATPAQAQEAHRHIREWIENTFGGDKARGLGILYGGSVKPDNSKALLAEPDLDGFLVGGAGLDANSFAEIIKRGLESRV